MNLATPNVLYFTDDAGTDFRLSYSVTGSGNIVLNTSPVIVTPTIASFVNAGHNHSNAAGGGTLAGSVVQMVYSLYGALATTTTILPGLNDDTIPQITEGGEFMSKAITPRSASNKLRIDVVFNGNEDANVSSCYTVALFNTDVHATNSIAAAQCEMAINVDIAYNTCFTHWMTAPGTGADIYSKSWHGGCRDF